MILKRVDPASAAKVFGVLYAFLGLILGISFSLFAMLGVFDAAPGIGLAGLLFGVGSVILFPIFYGLLGVVGGFIFAALYNLVARLVGGLEVEME